LPDVSNCFVEFRDLGDGVPSVRAPRIEARSLPGIKAAGVHYFRYDQTMTIGITGGHQGKAPLSGSSLRLFSSGFA
jgi:hypothetical protein